MNPRIKNKLLVLLLIILSSGQLYAQKMPWFWYEDNNMRTAGGFPPDFTEMFTDPGQWENLRDTLSIYLVRGNTLGKVIAQEGESFISDYFAPVLVEAKLPLAIDNPPSVAAWPGFYSLLTENGVQISYVGLQSVLSKPRNDVSPRYDPELEKRIQEVKNDISAYKQSAPDTKFGIIDARPTKGWEYKDAYRRCKEALESAGQSLDIILLDCPYSYVLSGINISYQKLKEVEAFVMDSLGVEYGLIITDNVGGMQSDAAFRESVMAFARGYDKSGTVPDHFILMSWFDHPSMALPEDAPEGEYPMTKVGLELFHYLGGSYSALSSALASKSLKAEPVVIYGDHELVFDHEKPINTITVYGITGQKIKTFSGNDVKRISTQALNPGIYLLQLRTEDRTFTTKVRILTR